MAAVSTTVISKKIVDTFRWIEMQELVKLMKRTSAAKWIVIDQRSNHSQGDWNGGHIKGAVNIPLHEFASDIGSVYEQYKERKYIVIHCMHSQVRGPEAAELYMEYLRANQPKCNQVVYVLKGGFAHFLNECIEHKMMHWIEEYDSSKWEFVDNRYFHVVEERLLSKRILAALKQDEKKESENEDDSEDEEESEH